MAGDGYAAPVPAIDSFTGDELFGSINSTDQTIGFSFTANGNLTVTALGVWEFNSAPLLQSHEVGLWNSTGTLVASATVLTSSPITDSSAYVDIAPVTLLAGQTYIAGSELSSPFRDVYARVDAVIGTVTTSPLITLGAAANSLPASGFAFPSTPDPTSLGRFGPESDDLDGCARTGVMAGGQLGHSGRHRSIAAAREELWHRRLRSSEARLQIISENSNTPINPVNQTQIWL
jgi:hypothetical protein